jgi:hypothetical protein
MSSEYTIPLAKIKLQQMPLFTYDKVIMRKDSELHLGVVVSHLELEDWADMNGYRMLSFESKRPAINSEKTRLTARAFNSAPPPSRHNTLMGIPTPSSGSVSPLLSGKLTLMGIQAFTNTLQPVPIKIID